MKRSEFIKLSSTALFASLFFGSPNSKASAEAKSFRQSDNTSTDKNEAKNEEDQRKKAYDLSSVPKDIVRDLMEPATIQPILDMSLNLLENKRLVASKIENLKSQYNSGTNFNSKEFQKALKDISDSTARAYVLPLVYSLSPYTLNNLLKLSVKSANLDPDLSKKILAPTGFHSQSLALMFANKHLIPAMSKIILTDWTDKLNKAELTIDNFDPLNSSEKMTDSIKYYLETIKSASKSLGLPSIHIEDIKEPLESLVDPGKFPLTLRKSLLAGTAVLPYLLSSLGYTPTGFTVAGFLRSHLMVESSLKNTELDDDANKMIRRKLYPLLPLFSGLFTAKQFCESGAEKVLGRYNLDNEDRKSFSRAFSAMMFSLMYYNLKTPAQKVLEDKIEGIMEKNSDPGKLEQEILKFFDMWHLPEEQFANRFQNR